MIHNSHKQSTVFFGASKFVLPILSFLQENYDLNLVITTEEKPTDAVPAYCRKHNMPFVSVSSLSELNGLKDQLASYNCQFAMLAYFGVIVPQSIINIFPKGIVNVHPSRLPQYRGPTPVQTALLLGDIRTGVSIMLLDKDVDHGPVLAQEEEEIYATDTAVSLYERLFPKGVALLEAVLPAYLSGELQPEKQNHDKATFTKTLTRYSGFIDTTKPISPAILDRMIRAYFPWPGAWTKWQANGKEKIVKFLPGKIIQVEGKKPMSYKDFLNGYPDGRAFLQRLQLI